MAKNPNHPKPGSVIKVEPIRRPEDIELIRDLLKDKPRDLCIFNLGINTNLRAIDLVNLKIGQVRYLKPGESLELRERKTKKRRTVLINNLSWQSIQNLLASEKMKNSKDQEYLFQSRNGKGMLRANTLNAMVKQWARSINLPGNFGSQSLRKTWAVQHYFNKGTSLAHIMRFMNHSSERISLEYLSITPQSEIDILMQEI